MLILLFWIVEIFLPPFLLVNLLLMKLSFIYLKKNYVYKYFTKHCGIVALIALIIWNFHFNSNVGQRLISLHLDVIYWIARIFDCAWVKPVFHAARVIIIGCIRDEMIMRSGQRASLAVVNKARLGTGILVSKLIWGHH